MFKVLILLTRVFIGYILVFVTRRYNRVVVIIKQNIVHIYTLLLIHRERDNYSDNAYCALLFVFDNIGIMDCIIATAIIYYLRMDRGYDDIHQSFTRVI